VQQLIFSHMYFLDTEVTTWRRESNLLDRLPDHRVFLLWNFRTSVPLWSLFLADIDHYFSGSFPYKLSSRSTRSFGCYASLWLIVRPRATYNASPRDADAEMKKENRTRANRGRTRESNWST